eukprot:GHVU01106293.1.p1 GENE.GHVU01106293.1~~GHVU01106293.1.p1  ORF type:complete len:1200 (+),score=130.59 GHVU01106293.1:360-3602(+)
MGHPVGYPALVTSDHCEEGLCCKGKSDVQVARLFINQYLHLRPDLTLCCAVGFPRTKSLAAEDRMRVFPGFEKYEPMLATLGAALCDEDFYDMSGAYVWADFKRRNFRWEFEPPDWIKDFVAKAEEGPESGADRFWNAHAPNRLTYNAEMKAHSNGALSTVIRTISRGPEWVALKRYVLYALTEACRHDSNTHWPFLYHTLHLVNNCPWPQTLLVALLELGVLYYTPEEAVKVLKDCTPKAQRTWTTPFTNEPSPLSTWFLNAHVIAGWSRDLPNAGGEYDVNVDVFEMVTDQERIYRAFNGQLFDEDTYYAEMEINMEKILTAMVTTNLADLPTYAEFMEQRVLHSSDGSAGCTKAKLGKDRADAQMTKKYLAAAAKVHEMMPPNLVTVSVAEKTDEQAVHRAIEATQAETVLAEKFWWLPFADGFVDAGLDVKESAAAQAYRMTSILQMLDEFEIAFALDWKAYDHRVNNREQRIVNEIMNKVMEASCHAHWVQCSQEFSNVRNMVFSMTERLKFRMQRTPQVEEMIRARIAEQEQEHPPTDVPSNRGATREMEEEAGYFRKRPWIQEVAREPGPNGQLPNHIEIVVHTPNGQMTGRWPTLLGNTLVSFSRVCVALGGFEEAERLRLFIRGDDMVTRLSFDNAWHLMEKLLSPDKMAQIGHPEKQMLLHYSCVYFRMLYVLTRSDVRQMRGMPARAVLAFASIHPRWNRSDDRVAHKLLHAVTFAGCACVRRGADIAAVTRYIEEQIAWRTQAIGFFPDRRELWQASKREQKHIKKSGVMPRIADLGKAHMKVYDKTLPHKYIISRDLLHAPFTNGGLGVPRFPALTYSATHWRRPQRISRAERPAMRHLPGVDEATSAVSRKVAAISKVRFPAQWDPDLRDSLRPASGVAAEKLIDDTNEALASLAVRVKRHPCGLPVIDGECYEIAKERMVAFVRLGDTHKSLTERSVVYQQFRVIESVFAGVMYGVATYMRGAERDQFVKDLQRCGKISLEIYEWYTGGRVTRAWVLGDFADDNMALGIFDAWVPAILRYGLQEYIREKYLKKGKSSPSMSAVFVEMRLVQSRLMAAIPSRLCMF